MTDNLNANSRAMKSASLQPSPSVQSVIRLTQLIVGVSCLTSAAAVITPDWWLGDLFANLRMQWAIALYCGLVVMLVTRQWKSAVVCLGFALGNTAFIANGLSLFDSDAAAIHQNSPTSITVCTFNVLTTNRNFDAVERQLLASDADVIIIPELSSGLERHLSGQFAAQYPYAKLDSRDGGNFGIGLYSRNPFSAAEVFLLNGNIPSVEAWLPIDQRNYYIVATHPVPPMGKRGFDHRNEHLNMLADRIRKVSATAPDTSLIVAGDLNVTPWSPIFTRFCSTSGLRRTGAGAQPTWYRFPAFPFGLVLDHVLASSDLHCHNYKVGKEAGSDHRIVIAKFTRQP